MTEFCNRKLDRSPPAAGRPAGYPLATKIDIRRRCLLKRRAMTTKTNHEAHVSHARMKNRSKRKRRPPDFNMHSQSIEMSFAHAQTTSPVGSESGCPSFYYVKIIRFKMGSKHHRFSCKMSFWKSSRYQAVHWMSFPNRTAAMITAGILEPPGGCGVVRPQKSKLAQGPRGAFGVGLVRLGAAQ